MEMTNFWHWFLRGKVGKSGIRQLLWNKWSVFHMGVALLLSFSITEPFSKVAATVLLPLASVFVGLTFAWSSNAQAILQTDEVRSMVEMHEDGMENYIWKYQSCILAIFVALVLWGLSGLGVFPETGKKIITIPIRLLICFFSSLALRECWHVVLGSQYLLLMRIKAKQLEEEEKAVNRCEDWFEKPNQKTLQD
jgi:hypothetical protein